MFGLEPFLRRNRKWLGRIIIFGPLAFILYKALIPSAVPPNTPPVSSNVSSASPVPNTAANSRPAQDAAERGRAEATTAADRAQRERDDQARREIADNAREFGQLRAKLSPKVTPLRAVIVANQKDLAGRAQRADFSAFQLGTVSPEEIASSAACSDPATTLDMIDRTKRRDRNILACAVYYAQHEQAEVDGKPGNPPGITMALSYRVHTADGQRAFPFSSIFAHIWDSYLAYCLETATIPDPMPPLTLGDSFNPALFRTTLPPSFARRLIETATTEEKLELTNVTFPTVHRMSEVATILAKACQKTGKEECRKALYR